MKHKITRIVIFLAILSVLIILIKGLNWVPVALEKGLMRKYDSINDVRTQLKMTNIYLPAYFPGEFVWPPSAILAQNEPYPAIALEFGMRDNELIGLVITQSSSPLFQYGEKADISSESRELEYSLKGKKALLAYGKCRGDIQCSKIKWKEKDQWLTIFAMTPSEELIRIAESMFPH